MLTSLALLALTSVPANRFPAQPSVQFQTAVYYQADTVSDPIPLTEGLLTNFIAAKKDLVRYWKAHQDLAHKSKGIKTFVQIGSQAVPINSFDYPSLVAKHADLAAIFKKHHFAPEQYIPVRAAAIQAVGAIAAKLIPASSIIGKNIALVKTYQQELAEVGVTVQVHNTPTVLRMKGMPAGSKAILGGNGSSAP